MNKRYIILITLILLAICGLRSETLQEQYQKVQDYKTDIFRQTKQFIIDNPDSPNVPKLYYNLAELSTSIYREEPDVILDLYKKVLKYDPDFYDKEVILYNIAYYSYKIAKNRIEDDRPKFAEKNPSFITWPENLKFSDEVFAEAKEFYSKIMQEYNYTDYYEESIFKMALLFSDIANDAEIPLNYYKKSAAFLSILLNRESVSGELRTDALFQRAWAYYSMSEWDKTISDFSEILRNDDAYTKLYYHDFAIENVAYSLVGIDSTDYFEYAESADYFVDEYAELFSDENNDKIIEEVIKLKLDLNAPMQAGDYYMARIRMNSLSIKSPTYIDSVLSLYTNYASLIREGKIYREVVKETSQYSIDNYGYNSEWYTSNRDNPEFMAFFNSIRDKFSRLETYYNNDLINETSVANYQKYIDLVNDYAAIPEFQDEIGLTWLNDKKDNMINFGFQLAESTGETEYYLFTYNLILDQEKINPDTTIVYRNENRLFQAAQNAYFKLKETVKDTTYFDSMNSIEITATYLDSLYIDGSARFYSVVTSDQFYNEDQYEIIKSILWNRSVINQELGNNNAVTTDLSELLKYDNDRIRVRDIYIILAQLHEGDKDFANSELYYAKAVEFANDEEDKEELEKSYLAQIDKNVTGLAETLDYIAAANEQLRLASKFDANTDAETVYDLRDKARGLFYQGGDYQRTIDIILKNAEFKSEKSDIHSLYYNAWAIADTLLSDSTQVMSIQNRFVSKFPTSNESFSIIIGQLVENAKHPQTRYDAATGYLDLHTKARNNSIDIGENKVEDIYKSAVNIYLEDEITNQDTLITLMQEFEKAYPNDPNSMDYLKYIAKIYLDTDETKYEEIAHYIYKKDPTVDLYSQIAYQKIDEVVKKVDDTFKNQDWDLMNQHISEVRELEKYYVSKDVTLDMVQVNEWFEYYQTEYTAWKEYQDYLADRNDFLTSYDKRLKSIRNTWVNAKDISIFRVNSNTEFKTHILNLQSKTIDKSKNRIQYVYKLASKKEQELVKLSQESTEWNMDVERKIRLFYVSAEIWDHAQKVVSRRLRYYYGQSNEVYEMKKTYGDDATKNLLDLKLKPATDNFVNMYNQEAINRYLNVFNVFVDGTGYTDKNIENMMPKILDLIPSLEVFDNTPGSDWIVENYVLAPQDSL
ncbi:MAG: hypothetical protein P9L91_02090, partial [Candidatus Zophobacter franzmannii]|nr:hypothetical protein [Candidatus Zophobacter franzmannii]